MERTFDADRQFRHHDVIVVYVYAECSNENHTLSSIMAICTTKILLNPIKILQKKSIYSQIFTFHIMNLRHL